MYGGGQKEVGVHCQMFSTLAHTQAEISIENKESAFLPTLPLGPLHSV